MIKRIHVSNNYQIFNTFLYKLGTLTLKIITFVSQSKLNKGVRCSTTKKLSLFTTLLNILVPHSLLNLKCNLRQFRINNRLLVVICGGTLQVKHFSTHFNVSCYFFLWHCEFPPKTCILYS